MLRGLGGADAGNDTIQARDGGRDTVLCGGGRDVAVVDRSGVAVGFGTARRT